MPLLEGLNPQQIEAVILPLEHALILAGAGSGKTRVLTTRIAHLIQTGQAGPHGILAVTFTNKAAKEMLARVSAMLPINTRGMWVGTFHGLCNRLLRAHHREAGLPQLFQILDSQDQLAVIKRVMKSLNVDDEKYPPRQVQYLINSNKEQGRRASQVEANDGFSRRVAEIYAVYDEQCNRESAVDFAELLLRCFELFERNQILREHYQGRFRHILVDEFQDTNLLQYRWLKLLAGERNAVFAVGDDDQSIYAFRGANTRNMQEFEREFKVSRVIRLEQNYRSHGNILDAANALIANNRNRLGKNLWTAETAGEPLRLYQAPSDLYEAAFIVDEIKELNAQGVALSDIALLYRSNAQSRVLEHALFSAALPYRVYGGLRFFERQEIKHGLAYLRLIANPGDDGALMRVINFPARGIGARTLELLQELAKSQAISLWQAALRKAGARTQDSAPRADHSSLKGVTGFVKLVEGMGAACGGLSLPEIIEQMLEMSGLKQHYQIEKDGADRLENLNELINAAAVFINDDSEGDANLTAFLAHAALEAGEHQAGEWADALQLMTAHSAKGLEFDTVFVSGLEEGLFPHENSLSEDGGLEEERRLMYVALTRAKRRLYLSLSENRMLHGRTRYHIASRFLQEIPENLVKWVTARYAEAGIPDSVVGQGAKLPDNPMMVSGNRLRGNLTYDSQFKTEFAWRVGQNVIHPKFGQGIIVNCEGQGADARVQVNFSRGGVKWLALEYAKLSPT